MTKYLGKLYNEKYNTIIVYGEEKSKVFTPIKNTKVYEHVINQIKEMIKDGTLKGGDKLPSERDLVEKLGVSRASIREALRVLEIVGIVECKQGEGNFIKSSFEDTLLEPLSIMFMLNDCKLKEIFQLRKVIEIETASLAAKQITDEEIIEIKKIITDIEISEDENEKVKLDTKFHYAVAKATQNFLIVSILNSVSTLMDSFIKDARKNIISKLHKDVIDKQHEEIWEALKTHNPIAAASSMRKHLDLINQDLTNSKA
ncbi:FadR family transcriptional regulator [Clostridium botulinum]|uniref:FadR family transcriptional regulator n=1 Tax=Clostridium botulinum TaxID=1491 RepID=A0A9Q4TCN6_CLOBO|nr:FadR/GntR family transcriptional regulator [Clostridium botulinum]NFD87221.1 FadR family transcriptional regulator [Clostridium botulinum]NFF69895.1 FadR family transcriptional regulator [Clostridium botulinum]NFO23373.1 FadR family transcriptional regulator [Clostridium botulinum]NFQ97520.1 FadR family transcriptional regulator [Clostridium botulinum]NFU56827.1 FadR family transcriptional regulator [Clostridium botulinum]